MISKKKTQCELASEYYYDILNPDAANPVPEKIMVHAANCLHCVKELARLHETLSEPITHEEATYVQQIPAQLVRHFSLLGVHVDCQTAKGFLPLMVDPELEITIPTPITVHLDNCLQCHYDYETLRLLNLESKQLAALARFFSHARFQNSAECSDVRKSIKAIAMMQLEGLTVDALKHACLCKDCRSLLYNERFGISNEVNKFEKPTNLPCEAVKATDLFVYCLPYGLDPANDQYAKFRPAFTSHVSSCPTCLEKLRQLNNTLFSIADRGESGVITCYELDSSTEKAGFSDISDHYTRYTDRSIKVQLLDKAEAKIDIAASLQKPARKVVAAKRRRFRIPAAAAIITIAVILFLLVPSTTEAIDMEQVLNALKRIKNIYMKNTASGMSAPVQETWISRTLKIRMLKTDSEYVLWDVNGKARKTRDVATGDASTMELNKDAIAKLSDIVKGPMGMLPSQVPHDSDWQLADDDSLITTIPGTQVYDFIYKDKAIDGSIVHRKWRGYIDAETKLPQRVERWEKLAHEKEYELTNVIEVVYLSAAQIRNAVSDAGF